MTEDAKLEKEITTQKIAQAVTEMSDAEKLEFLTEQLIELKASMNQKK